MRRTLVPLLIACSATVAVAQDKMQAVPHNPSDAYVENLPSGRHNDYTESGSSLSEARPRGRAVFVATWSARHHLDRLDEAIAELESALGTGAAPVDAKTASKRAGEAAGLARRVRQSLGDQFFAKAEAGAPRPLDVARADVSEARRLLDGVRAALPRESAGVAGSDELRPSYDDLARVESIARQVRADVERR